MSVKVKFFVNAPATIRMMFGAGCRIKMLAVK